MSCGTIVVVMSVILLSIKGNVLNTAQKHNGWNFEHNRPGSTNNAILFSGDHNIHNVG